MEQNFGIIPRDPLEVAVSVSELGTLVARAYTQGACSAKRTEDRFGIIGGWAVHYYVQDYFEATFGKPYLGSLDIDLFAHCTKRRTNRLAEVIKVQGFAPVHSFRWLKIFARGSGRDDYRAVTAEESERIPQFDLINLYLDWYCDQNCGTKTSTCTRGYRSWAIPELANTFRGPSKLHRVGVHEVLLPSLDDLLILKARAYLSGGRNPDKLRKDLCDITALLLYDGREGSAESIRRLNPETMTALAAALRRDENLTMISINLFNNPDTTYLARRTDALLP